MILLYLFFGLAVLGAIADLLCCTLIPLGEKRRYRNMLKENYSTAPKPAEKNEGYCRNQAKEKSGRILSRKKHVLTYFQKFLMFWFFATLIILVPCACSDGNGNWLVNIFECIRTAMRAFVVSDSIEELTQHIYPWFTEGVPLKFVEVYCAFAAFFCVTAGILASVFLVSLFKEFMAYSNYRYSLLNVGFKNHGRNIYVLSELNARSLALAENIFMDEERVRIYFCGLPRAKRDRIPELIHRAQLIGAYTMHREITEVPLRRCVKSQTVYLIGDNESENIEQARYIIESNKDDKKVNSSRTSLFVYANSHGSELMLDAMNQDLYANKKIAEPMKLRRVNTLNKFAVSYFWNNATNKDGTGFFDVYEADGNIKNLNVVMLGCGGYGSEFLKALCSMGQMPSYRLNVHIFDDNDNIKKSFVPELMNNSAAAAVNEKYRQESDHWYNFPYFNLIFEDRKIVGSQEFFERLYEIDKNSRITHVYLMLGNDDMNLDLAMAIRKRLNRENPDWVNRPLINAIVKDDVKAINFNSCKELEKFNVIVLGANSSRYSKREIEQTYIENYAVNVHRNFWLKSEMKKFEGKLALKNPDEIDVQENRKILVAFRQFEHNINFPLRANSAKDEDHKSKLIREVDKCILESMAGFEEGTQAYKMLDDEFKKVKEKVSDDNQIYREGFGQREYYRRSCIYRVVFEKVLFDLGYLKKSELKKNKNCPGRIGIKENLVPDYDKTFIDHMTETVWKENYDKVETFNYAWAELNNILQKRWMAFMYGEGYDYGKGDGNGAEDRLRKLHEYLKPYQDIYCNAESNARHTIEISYFPPKEENE